MEDHKTKQERPAFGAAEMMQALMPITAAMLKPVAKTMIKFGILAYEMGKSTWDELSEEARAELARSREASARSASGGSTPVQDVEPQTRATRKNRPTE
jgi:hypothetical protein